MNSSYNAIVLAVSHMEFLTIDFSSLRAGDNTVIFDIKSCLNREIVDGRL